MKNVVTKTKKHFNDNRNFYAGCFATGLAIGTVVTVRRHTAELTALHKEAAEAKEVLSIIWSTYLPDPELAQGAAVCNIASHQ